MHTEELAWQGNTLQVIVPYRLGRVRMSDTSSPSSIGADDSMWQFIAGGAEDDETKKPVYEIHLKGGPSITMTPSRTTLRSVRR